MANYYLLDIMLILYLDINFGLHYYYLGKTILYYSACCFIEHHLFSTKIVQLSDSLNNRCIYYTRKTLIY